jgi:hypothetical protein
VCLILAASKIQDLRRGKGPRSWTWPRCKILARTRHPTCPKSHRRETQELHKRSPTPNGAGIAASRRQSNRYTWLSGPSVKLSGCLGPRSVVCWLSFVIFGLPIVVLGPHRELGGRLCYPPTGRHFNVIPWIRLTLSSL